MSARLDWHGAEILPLKQALDGRGAKGGEVHGRRLSKNGDDSGSDQAYYDSGRVE